MEKIRQRYRENEGKLQSPPWCEEFNFSLENLFTKVKIVKKDGQIGQSGQIDHLIDIFREIKYGQKPRTVLIEGQSGMGKTTYCQKLAYDWASNQEEFKKLSPQMQVLLSLKCEKISSDIWEAIDAQVLPEDVDEQSKEMFFKFIQENQSNVLLILDGVDDMPPDNLQMISQLVNRELPQCHFLLTAQRATTVEVRECCGTSLEIVGFTEEDGKKFISEYFKDQESLAKKLFDLLDEFDHLREELFPGNPIYTALLCLLCKDLNGVFPTSRTQVYTEMILCALRRYETMQGKSSSDEDLIEVYKDNLTSLGLKAFNSQRKGDLHSEEDEETLNNKDLPGFTSAQTVSGTSRLWYAFQQFFAGFFVAFKILGDKIDLNGIVADESYFEPPLRQVFLFMSGILSLHSEEKALDLVTVLCSRINSLALGITEDIEELEILLMLALESSEYAPTEHRNKHISTLGSCLKLDRLAIGLSPFPKTDYRDLLESDALKWSKPRSNPRLIGYPHFASLARPFSEALKHNTILNSLHLDQCTPYGKDIDPLWADALSGALKVNSSLTNLDLRSNRIGDSDAQALSDALEINTTLTKLDLSDNSIGASGARFLSTAIKINASLTTLNLARNKITCEPRHGAPRRPFEIAMLPTFCNIGKCTFPEALKKLDEFFTGMDETMDDYGLFSLSESLKTNTTLTNLNLEGNEIDRCATFYLSESLKTNATLTTLNLRGTSVSHFGSKCLSLALKTNGTLTSLNLSHSGISAHALSEGLKVNTALTSLDLASNGIDDNAAKALFDVLLVNATLTTLHLGWNKIGAKGTQYICEALARNNTLTSLDFSWNEIGGAGALFFSEALQSNRALNDLNLNFIRTDERGAICLFDALKRNTTLSTMDLTGLGAAFRSSKKITHVPFYQLSDALKVNTTLSCLRLGQCGIRSHSDAQLFFTSLMDNKTLKELDLNQASGARFKMPPEFLANNTALTHLNLSSSLCEDLSALAPFFEGLTVNSTLTTLKLRKFQVMDSNGSTSTIGDSECELISETLKVNTTLTDLDLSVNSIGEVGIKCIMEALKVNNSLKLLDLCCQQVRHRFQTNPPSLRKINTSVFVVW